MKLIITCLLLFIAVTVKAQFHEKVIPVGSMTVDRNIVGRKTLFIIAFTNDNWKTTDYILDYDEIQRFQHTGGVDWKMEIGWKRTDGFVPFTFDVKLNAIHQAEKLNTYSKCIAFNKNVINKRKQFEKETDDKPTNIY